MIKHRKSAIQFRLEANLLMSADSSKTVTAALSPKQRVYRDFFRKQVKDAGVKHPFELKGKDLTKFFANIKKEYKKLKRRNEYQEKVDKYAKKYDLASVSNEAELALFGAPTDMPSWVKKLSDELKKYSLDDVEYAKPYVKNGKWLVNITLFMSSAIEFDWLASIAKAVAKTKGDVKDFQAHNGKFVFIVESPVKA